MSRGYEPGLWVAGARYLTTLYHLHYMAIQLLGVRIFNTKTLLHAIITVINPWHMRCMGNYGNWLVCVCVCVCVTTLNATYSISKSKITHYRVTK